jgi:hypothetical protein
LGSLSGCEFMAVRTAPAKVAAAERLPSAELADRLFWKTLHSGDYAGIPPALNAMTAAYLENPSDATSAARVGWLHIWRLSERARLAFVPATITDDATLARRYFEEAVALQPDEARFLGFLGSATLAEASIHKNEKQTRQGYYTLRRSIDAWPEFNLFTAGYSLSLTPAESPQFKEGLEWQWQTLDLCAGEKVSRSEPSFQKYMAQATQTGPKRVCWNSEIAPHNFEGFFMNMGDMLVKAGDWQAAKAIYANARLSSTYPSWAYKGELEARIEAAKKNVLGFNSERPPAAGSPTMMIRSAYACMACHQS